MHIRIDVRSGKAQVNVKDHGNWANDPRARDQIRQLSASTISAIYEATKEDFWCEADQTTNEFGYGEAYAEGRSGGWLETSGGPRFSSDGMEWESDEYKQFEEFAKRITALKASYEKRFIEELTEEVADLERRRKNAIVRSNN